MTVSIRYCGWTEEVHTHPMDPPDYSSCEAFATGPDLLCDEHRAEQIRQAEYAEAWARDYAEEEEW